MKGHNLGHRKRTHKKTVAQGLAELGVEGERLVEKEQK